jgi:ferredoxin
MPRLTIRDRDHETHEVEVPFGANLLQTIQDQGLDINSSCGGGGQCSTCTVNVLEGKIGNDPHDRECALSGPDAEDLNTMEDNGLDPNTQVLSCQACIYNDCKVALPDC